MSPLVNEQQDPRYRYLQIELTSRCNLRCRTCLRAVPDIKLKEQDLSAAALRQLQPALRQTASVHLQGWGEAMLLQDMVERIRWFKAQDCMVSFTTNGSLMTKRQAAQLVASGLDSITFSMAGAAAGIQDRLRGQGTHKKLWQSLHLLHQEKLNQGAANPSLAVSYLLTPETIGELPAAVKQCRSLGLNLFAGVHLTHAATGEQEFMRLYVHSFNNRFKQIIRRAHWQAFLGGMRLQMPPFQPVLMPVCDKNPLAGCFIASDGSVAPCVFLYPPSADREEQWFTENGAVSVPGKCFGSLNENSLDMIWQGSEYRAFRKVFRQRQQVYDCEMAKVGLDLDAIEKLELAQHRIRKVFLNMPVPVCCRGCPKMEGF